MSCPYRCTGTWPFLAGCVATSTNNSAEVQKPTASIEGRVHYAYHVCADARHGSWKIHKIPFTSQGISDNLCVGALGYGPFPPGRLPPRQLYAQLSSKHHKLIKRKRGKNVKSLCIKPATEVRAQSSSPLVSQDLHCCYFFFKRLASWRFFRRSVR